MRPVSRARATVSVSSCERGGAGGLGGDAGDRGGRRGRGHGTSRGGGARRMFRARNVEGVRGEGQAAAGHQAVSFSGAGVARPAAAASSSSRRQAARSSFLKAA